MSTTAPGSTAADVHVVIGGTGQQGGATARALLARGAHVRVLVRDATSPEARELARLGASLVVGNLDDPPSVRSAMDGAVGVFVMTSLSIERWTEGEVAHGETIADAAKAARVEHVVYSSVAGADRATGIPHFESKRRVEQYIDSLGLSRTFVRPVFFMDNFNRAAPTTEHGVRVLRLPLPADASLQLIAVADIGRVSAAALLSPGLIEGGAIEIAGDTQTCDDIATILGKAAGLDARFESLPLSTLDGDEDRQAMFAWYATPVSTTADVAQVRSINPQLLDLTTWSQAFLRRA